MSDPSYRLFDRGEGTACQILSIEEFWTGETGTRYADCLVNRDGRHVYWSARVDELVAEQVTA